MSAAEQTLPVAPSNGQSDQADTTATPSQVSAASQAQPTHTTTEPANTVSSSDLSDTEGRWRLGPYCGKKTKQRPKHFSPHSRYTVEKEDDESDDEDPQRNAEASTTPSRAAGSVSRGSSNQNTLPTSPAHSTRNWRERSPAHPSRRSGPGTYTHTIDLSTLATIVYQGKTYIRVGWAEGHRINKEYWAYARVGDDGAVHQVFGCGIVFDDRPMFYESKFARKDAEAWTREVGEAVARVEARHTDRSMAREDAYARLTTTRANGGVSVSWQPDVSASVAPSTVTYQSTTVASPTESDEPVVDVPALTPAATHESETFILPAEPNETAPSAPALPTAANNQTTSFTLPTEPTDQVSNPFILTTEQSTSSNTANRVYDSARLLALAQASSSPDAVLSDDLLAKLSSLDIAQHLTIHANPNAITRALLKHCHGNSIPEDHRIRSLFGFQALASVDEEAKLLQMYQDAIRIGLSKGRLEGWLHRYMLFGKIIELFDRLAPNSTSQRWLSANMSVLQRATLQSVFDWVDAAKGLRNTDNVQAESDKEPAFSYEEMAADVAAAAKIMGDDVSADGVDVVEPQTEMQEGTSAQAGTNDTEGWDDAELGPWTSDAAESAMAEDLAGIGGSVNAAGEVMGDLIDFGEDETVGVSQGAASGLHQQDAEAEDEGTKPDSSKAGKGGDDGEEFWGL